jgi:L-ribulose-5-phosphate 4-epimerase
MLKDVKQRVWQANLDLVSSGLVTLTWGNASEILPNRTAFVIKPSGVPYDRMKPSLMAVVDLEGRTVDGDLNPSSDAETHRLLYRGFPGIGGVVHTHSPGATAFAQARCEIPCLGTTHADHFFGAVPVTRTLTEKEVREDYEANTGRIIVERFARRDYASIPAVLVAGHGPFAWGKDAADAVRNAVALEAVARMALDTLALDPRTASLEAWMLQKHHDRKHGPGAYYGQKGQKRGKK